MSDIVSFLNGTINGSAGVAQGKVGTTVQTFAISLAAGFVLFAVQFGTFLIVRNFLWAKRIYQPRSFLIPLKNRIVPPANNPFKWLWTVFRTREDPELLQKAGMDAYFFLRYLSMCLKIFTPMTVIILPILLPLNVIDGKDANTIAGVTYNITGLDTLAWSNVSPEHTSRYWAHLILAVIVIIWVCFIFHQELLHYIIKRQEFLGSPSHRLKASSTTVLIMDIPQKICNLEALTELYDDFPGGIRRIWINRVFEPLVEKDKQRKRYEDLLENAETDLIRKATKRFKKLRKREGKDGAGQSISEQRRAPVTPSDDGPNDHAASGASNMNSQRRSTGLRGETHMPATPTACESDLRHDLETHAAWTRYLDVKHRQTMRIPSEKFPSLIKIPLVGRFFSIKVDTIYYCRRELARLNKEIETEIETSESSPRNGSAFIQFNSQLAAHLACQAVADVMPRRMTKRAVEISPADINWSNLGLSWRVRYFRFVGFLALFLLLIFLFGVLSFFTGILSRASTLAGSTSWLRWIASLPSWLLSFISGTLPPVIQVIVLSGPLPILLRAMTNNTEGATTGSEGERSLQLWYFIFLLFELFIIPTISSGLTSVVEELIHTPASVPNILATNLPTAANYYFSFLIVQALSISASSILQTIRLFNYYVLGGVNTPDSVYRKLSWTNMTRIGSNIPWYTTFAVIGLVYSVIAPLMLAFMLLTFSLFWMVIKNNILYVIRTGNVDGGGLFFPSAINQLFTGLYFMEICLIGLFFLVRDAQDQVACEAQGIIMAVTLVFTIFYQIWLANNFRPLYKYAPVRLEQHAIKRDKEYEMERLTTSVPRESASTARDGEVSSVSAGNTATASEETGVGHNPNIDLEKHHSSSHPPPTPITRSSDIQAQQRKDGQHAKRILARLNRPLDETRLAALEAELAEVERHIRGNLVPRSQDVERQMMNDPISKIIMQHNDELEDLDAEERDLLISVAFTHPVLRETKPSVWIPEDEIGVSDDEVRRTRGMSRDVAIDNRGAYFDKKLRVVVNKPPPDMSEFALVMAEL